MADNVTEALARLIDPDAEASADNFHRDPYWRWNAALATAERIRAAGWTPKPAMADDVRERAIEVMADAMVAEDGRVTGFSLDLAEAALAAAERLGWTPTDTAATLPPKPLTELIRDHDGGAALGLGSLHRDTAAADTRKAVLETLVVPPPLVTEQWGNGPRRALSAPIVPAAIPQADE
jgi:hypothetical protein